MALPHARPGELIDASPLGARLAQGQTATLLKTARLEVIRLVLPAGKRIDSHSVPGELTLHCLEGAVEIEARGRPQVLTPGALLYLAGGDEHALRAIEESTVLVTIVLSLAWREPAAVQLTRLKGDRHRRPPAPHDRRALGG
jgi:quercetin dioxygenase-like cupin family protein